jgi:integrase
MPTQDKKTRLWIGRVRLVGFPTKFKRGFQTKKEAAHWEREQADQLKTPQAEVLKSSNAVLDYLEYCEKRFKPTTCNQKAFIFRSLLTHINIDPPIANLTPRHIESYLDSRLEKSGNKAANRDLREIKSLFNWLITRKYLTENPCTSLERHKEEVFIKYVPPAEDIKAVLSIADDLEYDLIQTAYFALARAGEIRNLLIEDCDFEKNMLTLWTSKRKGGATESDQIEMADTLKRILKERAATATTYVFEREGQPISKRYLDKVLPRLCKKAGVKEFTFHSIRHHVAAILATKLPLIEIQKILRHKRATTTDIYLRSLVKVTTKGIKILDDLSVDLPENVVSFDKAVNGKM